MVEMLKLLLIFLFTCVLFIKFAVYYCIDLQ